MARSPSNLGVAGWRQIWTNIHDLMTRMARAYRNIKVLDETCAKLDSGNGGTEFPDGQVFTGNQYLHDTLAQDSNYVWIQDSDTFDFGGVIILDYDIQSGNPPVEADIVSVFGLAENPEQLGTKTTGVFFAQPTYKPYVGSAYDGNVQFQSLNIPITSGGPLFQWPQTDGPAGGTLTTNGAGALYWTDPPDPPELIVDTDQTDYLVDNVTGNLAPVTVTATRPAAPAQVSFECTFWTGSNNRGVIVELLVDGVAVGETYTTLLPRNTDTFVHHSWSVLLPNGNEVLTIRHTANGIDVWVYGTATDTKLALLLPSVATVQSAYSQGSTYIISPDEFWARWSDTAVENLAKLLNHAPIGGPPASWLDVGRAQVFVALYSAQNINLLDALTIDNINELVTLGVLTPAEAVIILTT